MLTKRTYFAHVLTASALALAAALPGTAAAAPSDGSRAALAEGIPLTPLTESVVHFHRTIDREVQRIRAEHRAAQRRERREEREAFEALPGGISPATLEAIASCESGGDPTIVSADGSYRGKYQFSFSTWASVGGSGDPAAAPEIEQDYRAALLYSQAGPSPWPVCGL